MPPQDTGTDQTGRSVAEQPVTEENKVIPLSGKNFEKLQSLLDSSQIVMRETDFHFKKDKKLGSKRPSVKLALPIPTLQGVVEVLQTPKGQEFILSLLEDSVISAARFQVSDEDKPVNDQDSLDMSQLSLDYLINQPKAERRGGGISKETWDDFAADYLAVMPALTNKTAELVGNAIKLFTGRLQAAKTNKAVLAFLKEQLALWFANTTKEKQEDLQEVYDFLDTKATTFLAMDDAALLSNL